MINMLIGNLLLLLNLTNFSLKMLKLKKNIPYILPISIIIGILILSSRSYPMFGLIGTLLMAVYYIFFIFFLFNGEMSKKILTFILYFATVTASEVLSANIMNLLVDLREENINSFLYTLALLLSAGIAYILLSMLSKFINIYSEYKLPKTIWLIFVLPITTILLMINLSGYFNIFRNNILFFPIIIGFLIANVITVYIFFQTIKALKLENTVKEVQAKYDTINMLYQNNFNFLHDTIWKLNLIYQKIKEKEYDGLPEEVEDLSKNLLRKYNIINTNSSIIGSILNYRLNEILTNNIHIKSDITYNNFSFLESETQVHLFSILINNAIDSCLSTNCSERNILISSKEINGQILIRCLYSFSENYKEKNDDELAKIRQIVSHQNGMFTHSTNDKEYSDITIFFKPHK